MSTPPSRSIRLLLAAGGLAMIAAGCGSAAKSTAASSTVPAPAAGTAGASSQIKATLTEFKMQLSSTSVAPGTYTFVATNAGSTVHALEIQGPGVSSPRTAVVQPGQTTSLTVTLPAGSFQVFCPVGTHKELGMDTVLTVGGAGTAVSGVPSSAGGY